METKILKKFRQRFTILEENPLGMRYFCLIDHKYKSVHRHMWDGSPKEIQAFSDAVITGLKLIVGHHTFEEHIYTKEERKRTLEYFYYKNNVIAQTK